MSRKSIVFFTIIVLSLLYTPFAYSSELHSGILGTKQFWVFGFFSVFFFSLAAIVLIRPRQKLIFRFNIIDVFILSLFIYLSLLVIFQPQPVISNFRYINFALLTVFFFALKHIVFADNGHAGKRQALVIKIIVLYAIILTGLLQAIVGFLQLFDVKKSFHTHFKITGTFVNPGPYAMYLSIIFPMAIGIHFYFKDKILALARSWRSKNRFVIGALFFEVTAYIPLITVIIIAMILPATMIRASWVAVVAGTVVILIFYYRFQLIRNTLKLFMRSRSIFGVAIGVLTISVLILSFQLFNFKIDSSKGKLLIWRVTGEMVKKHPYFGIGFGRFEAEYNNYQSNWFCHDPSRKTSNDALLAGNTKYAFCDMLEILAETGVTGLALFAGLIIGVFTTLIGYQKPRQLSSDQSGKKREDHGLGITLLGCCTAGLICMVLSFPFAVLPILILFFFILAMVSSTSQRFFLQKTIELEWLGALCLICMLLLFSISIGVYNYKQVKAYFIWDEADMLYKTGNYRSACASYAEIYPTLKYNGEFLQFYGKSLFQMKEYRKSLDLLQQASLYNSDVFLFLTKGDCLKELKEFGKAEESYLFASNMMPGMLYPKYKLVLIYRDSGEAEKLKTVGKDFLNGSVKLNSYAVEEMKEKVRTILEVTN